MEEKPKTKIDLSISFSAFINEKAGSYNEDYKLGGVLGTGAFSQVRKVTHRRTKAVRAMKVIDKKKIAKEEDQKKLLAEIQVMRMLDHPNILKMYEFYQDEKNYYLIIELCTGGELFDKIIEQGTLSEKEASYIMKQLLSAVYYAHNNSIAHRDLKPENILLDIASDGTYNIKVIDWGTAKHFDADKPMTDKYGTLYYMAPEVMKREYNEKCDIWSCGVILYILLSGNPPFGGRSDKDIIKNVLKGEYSITSEEWAFISDSAKSLLAEMLKYDYTKRISAKNVLNHPWFQASATMDKVSKENFEHNLQNLKNFRAEQKLQQAAFAFIASHLTSKEERNQLIAMFKSLDKNGDGTLSREEILEGYIQMMSEEDAINEVNRIMAEVDLDKSGEIDYTEFVAATIDRRKLLSKDKLVAAFNLFDKDGDGSITASELKEVLGSRLASVDDKVWDDIIKEVDINGDGVISFDEFSIMMTKYAEQ